MKVVITGGLGFIGTALAKELLCRGHGVLLIDGLVAQVHGEVPAVDVPVGAMVVRMDVRDLPSRHELFEGCDVVCHLAAETGTAQSMHRMAHYVQVNDVGTAALFEAVAKCVRRPTRVLLASSRSVYGEGAYRDPKAPDRLTQPEPRTAQQLARREWDHRNSQGDMLESVATPELMLLRPASVYAATKAAQEMLVSAAANALGMRGTILRFQNVYGEGQSLLNPYTGIISIFFNRARQGLPLSIYEDGRESRDFVHVGDVVKAMVMALEADLPPLCTLNVGSGLATSVEGLARSLLHAAGLDVRVEITGQFRLGDIRHCFADLNEIHRLLGWSPSVDLHEGLRRFCAWATEQPVHADRLDMATDELERSGMAGRLASQTATP